MRRFSALAVVYDNIAVQIANATEVAIMAHMPRFNIISMSQMNHVYLSRKTERKDLL